MDKHLFFIGQWWGLIAGWHLGDDWASLLRLGLSQEKLGVPHALHERFSRLL